MTEIKVSLDVFKAFYGNRDSIHHEMKVLNGYVVPSKKSKCWTLDLAMKFKDR